jgi:hypothetical protein
VPKLRIPPARSFSPCAIYLCSILVDNHNDECYIGYCRSILGDCGMKSLLTLSVLLAILTLAKPPGRVSTSAYLGSPPVLSALSFTRHEIALDNVREEFQVGPLFLQVDVRDTQNDPAGNSSSAIYRVGVNTRFSTSLNPLSIRVIVVLNLETNQSADRNESALLRIPNAKSPPVWEGSIAGLISGC